MTQAVPLYAQNQTLIDTAADQLESHMSQHAACTWMALIDTAFDQDQTTPALGKFAAFNCYDFPDLEGMTQVAPYLIELPDTLPQGLKTALRLLLHHASGRPMLSFVALPQGTTPLQVITHWHSLHWAHTSDNQKLLLRFADTRTLKQLPQILTPEQWAAWTSPLSAWYVVDRAGAIAPLPWPEGAIAPPPINQLDIDAAQLAAFIESSEPDVALQFLQEHLPDILPADMTGHDFYIQASDALDTARQYGIDQWGDQMALVAATLMSNGSLLKAPEMHLVLAKGEWKPGELGPHLAAQAAFQPYVSQPNGL